MRGIALINQHTVEPPSSPSLHSFFAKQLELIKLVLDIPFEAVFCSRAGHLIETPSNNVIVVGATLAHRDEVYENVDSSLSLRMLKLMYTCFETQTDNFSSDYAVVYLNYSSLDAVLLLETSEPVDAINLLLLKSLTVQISIKFHSFNLFKKLKTTTFKDWLTKLPNRSEFLNQISKAKSDYQQSMIIALVDIKHFSDINDGLGLDIGNSVLLDVANRLRQELPKGTNIGRITGDVFGIIGNEKDIAAENIHKIFSKSFQIGPHCLPINVNIGICSLTKDGDSSDFLRGATIALNTAKASNSENVIVYDTQMEANSKERLQTLRDLQSDFESQKLEVWYQPQVDLISEEIVGLEALVRWKNADGDYVSPERFIPLAEYSGLIVDIGEWVFEEAIKTLKMVRTSGFSNLRMAVNVSVLQFRDINFVNFIKQTITKHQVNPALVELEITEGVVMDEPQIVVIALHDLKSFGVTIAIDDFGTGFSSMSYLQKLPLDRLKVDRSFVSDLNDKKNKVIVQSILSLGVQLGLVTIAEGVETRSQASMMLRMGADEAQGYLFSDAVRSDELMSMLINYKVS